MLAGRVENLKILQFVKNATTKEQTRLAGSNTFYFRDNTVMAYNDVICIKAKFDVDINGSVLAEPFYQLLSKVNNPVIEDGDRNIFVRYGKQVAKVKKVPDKLKMYVDMIHKMIHTRQPIPNDFIQALSTSLFQSYSNKVSGVYIDDDTYYAIDSNELSVYYGEEGFSETFWIPREGVQLLVNIPEEITECALSRSFFYVFTETFTIAIKLKIAEQYHINRARKYVGQFTDFTHTITVPPTISETLGRIRLGTMRNTKGRYVFYMTTGKELVIQSITSADTDLIVRETLDYEFQNRELRTYVKIWKYI